MKVAEFSGRRGGVMYVKLVDVPNDANILPIYEAEGEVVVLFQSKHKQVTLRQTHCLKSIVKMLERTRGRGEFQGLVGAVSDAEQVIITDIKDAKDQEDPD